MESWSEKFDTSIASLGLRRSSIICKPDWDLSVAKVGVVMTKMKKWNFEELALFKEMENKRACCV